MSDNQAYIKFAVADFSRVKEYAVACKSMLGTQICDAVVSALKKEIAVPVQKEWDKSIGEEKYYRYVCPECENVLRSRSKFKYCPYYDLYVAGRKCKAAYQQYPKKDHPGITLQDKIKELEGWDK